MNSPPQPTGSSIDEIDEFDGRTYQWLPPQGGVLRYAAAGFFCIWLCGWAVGWVAVFVHLFSNKNLDGGQLFAIVWLAFWTVGGMSAMYFLYLLVRKGKPERVTLGLDTFLYDSGTAPPIALVNPWYMMQHATPTDPFGGMLRRRKLLCIAKRDLAPVRLEHLGTRQRLTFDHGADRIEIGLHLREPDREWLAAVIEAWQNSRA